MARLFLFDAPSLASFLTPDLLAGLCAAGTRMSYADRALVQWRGDARPGLSIVHDGAVQIGNPGLDGSFVVTSILGPGHCFGEMTLFGDLPRTHDAVAVGATVIDQVSPAAYERFAEANPPLTRAILAMMARRLHVLLEFADPALEARSAGQKVLLRIGSANAARIKAKLRDIRAALIEKMPAVAPS